MKILGYRTFNKADGVKGNYCVGRMVDKGDGLKFWQYWTGESWASAGKIYTHAEAMAIFNKAKQGHLN